MLRRLVVRLVRHLGGSQSRLLIDWWRCGFSFFPLYLLKGKKKRIALPFRIKTRSKIRDYSYQRLRQPVQILLRLQLRYPARQHQREQRHEQRRLLAEHVVRLACQPPELLVPLDRSGTLGAACFRFRFRVRFWFLGLTERPTILQVLCRDPFKKTKTWPRHGIDTTVPGAQGPCAWRG